MPKDIHCPTCHAVFPPQTSVVVGGNRIKCTNCGEFIFSSAAAVAQPAAPRGSGAAGLSPGIPTSASLDKDATDNGCRTLETLFGKMKELGASDLHLKLNSPPVYRINGKTWCDQSEPLDRDTIQAVVDAVLTESQVAALQERASVDFSIHLPDGGRFRANIFSQRGSWSIAARRVSSVIPSLEELLLPRAMGKIAAFVKGLVLVTGLTGSGKTSTLAALVNIINQTRPVHVITLEDPIEFIHPDQQAIVSQREIGIDTPDFVAGLRDALRQDPDVILLGELRDTETVKTAISASETGHLVMSTLHTTSAADTITRLLDFFPTQQHASLRRLLSTTLRAIVGQRLIDGNTPAHPRVPMVELLFVNHVIRQCIADGDFDRIPRQYQVFSQAGMQDFNMSLYKLVIKRLISRQTATKESPKPKELEVLFSINV